MDKQTLTNVVWAVLTPQDISTLSFDNMGLIADRVLGILPGIGCTKAEIVEILKEEFTIHMQPAASVLADEEQESWLNQFKAAGGSDWKFWNDYKKYLELPLLAKNEIDKTTDRILDMMANPRSESNWYRAGLVVGNVQSGKTGNFIGLINKSLDAGFKIILVLTGMYDDLRAQTQSRIDKGVIGRISDPDNRHRGNSIGVGNLKNHPNVISLTSSNLHGDFKPAAQSVNGVLTSRDPTIIVCKKNSSILKNVLEFFASAGIVADDGYKVINDIPLLVIDDEADSASINVNVTLDEASKINGRIRAILALFSKAAYVGYTATPYANIFISTAENNQQSFLEISDTDQQGNRINIRRYRLGKYDIFPRNFIINLTASSNYIGANAIFGIASRYGEEKDPLPIISNIDDGYDRIRRNNFPGYIPESMKDAILHYFVATAVRRARGQKTAHSSMLINVSQYVTWQNSIYEYVCSYVSELCDKIGSISTYPALIRAMKDKFSLIQDTQKKILSQYPEWRHQLTDVTWEAVLTELPYVALKVKSQVRVLHSGEADVDANTTRLDYSNYENQHEEINNGLYIIAVGGNTLSRGLTLEGLCTSYFLRSSKTFDTLMQMGRWYGYRDGYVDTCRLYMHKDMVSDLSIIAKATQEMRDQFDDMVERGIKPTEYGLKVMCIPGHLEATARNKFGDTDTGQLSYSLSTVQAYQILNGNDVVEQNKQTVERFLSGLEAKSPSFHNTRNNVEMRHYFWKADSSAVLDFIDQFGTATVQMNKALLKEFIKQQVNSGNLTNWTVALINVDGGNDRRTQQFVVNGKDIVVGKVKRQFSVDVTGTMYVINNASITGPEHDSLDLSEDEYREALTNSINAFNKAKSEGKTKKQTAPTVPDRNEAKKIRNPQNGLLLLFSLDLEGAGEDIMSYAISFPRLDSGTVGYIYRGQTNAFTVK